MKEKVFAVTIGHDVATVVHGFTELDAILRVVSQMGVLVEEFGEVSEDGTVPVVKKTTFKADAR